MLVLHSQRDITITYNIYIASFIIAIAIHSTDGAQLPSQHLNAPPNVEEPGMQCNIRIKRAVLGV